MSKRTVKYWSATGPIEVGGRAVIIPLDHPDTFNVSNHIPAVTSTIVSVDRQTGNFETLNTHYVYTPQEGE